MVAVKLRSIPCAGCGMPVELDDSAGVQAADFGTAVTCAACHHRSIIFVQIDEPTALIQTYRVHVWAEPALAAGDNSMSAASLREARTDYTMLTNEPAPPNWLICNALKPHARHDDLRN